MVDIVAAKVGNRESERMKISYVLGLFVKASDNVSLRSECPVWNITQAKLFWSVEMTIWRILRDVSLRIL